MSTTDAMAVPAEILRLIEKFDLHRDAYRSGQYNETQVRREFIDPFFTALGWDVDNRQGYAEAYKDVVHEDAIKIGGASKAPDYSFRIGGTRKFFLEAKKPAVNVKDDPGPAYQLRRYAWSAKLPLSILTDFEEFAVYDTRIQPQQEDRAGKARVLYLKYTDYTERWADITSVFSRDAVLKGSFDKYAESNKQKRGTVEVDDAFLAEIERWRDLLAKSLALRNPSLHVRELNYAVQVTIDRIVFLRMCEDRGIEPYGQLRELATGSGVYGRLRQLFERADEKYNSGLFHFATEKGRLEAPDSLTPGLMLEDTTLKSIIKNLYYPESPYEFSVLSAEILGQVYEQFLGKVIRLTAGHRAVVEEKPEVKKAGGVYYTPSYIVDYIVKETVGKLLDGKTPKQAAKVRVLDPACGSGSFLIGAYQYLLDWHRDRYLEEGAKKHPKEVYEGPGGMWYLTSAEKKRILLNSIYGVDIDTQAVEVTKLSLLLKVLEGESEQSLATQLRMFRERALPDLGDNIKCGNSLIASDFYRDVQTSFLDEEEVYRVNAFDWEDNENFGEIMKAGRFDAVIGNPPYIRIQRIDHDQADYLFARYSTPASKTDLSQLFLERSLHLVSKTGFIGLICTSQWLATDYGRNMRRELSDGRLHALVDFGSLPVFRNADTYPAIFVLSPRPAKSLRVKRIRTAGDLNLRAVEQAAEESIPLDNLTEAPWNLGTLDVPSAQESKGLEYRRLSAFGNAYIGDITGMVEVFVVDGRMIEEFGLEPGILLPYANDGAEVKRYRKTLPKARVIYPYRSGPDGAPLLIPEDELKGQFPNAHRYLLGHKDALRERQDSRRYYARGADWYRHLRAGSFKHIRPSKLIVKGIEKYCCVGLLGEDTAFYGSNCPGVIFEDLDGYDPLYFLGVLNSKVISYHARQVCPPKLGGYFRFGSSNINTLPIRTPNLDDSGERNQHNSVVKLVRGMVELNTKLDEARTSHDQTVIRRQIESLDRQIDRLAYELYGLAEAEIATVEEALS